jgi:hypothetical protein
MVTRPKKSQAKKPTKKTAAAKASTTAVRRKPAPKAPPAPVLVNAVEPDEKLPAAPAGPLNGAVDTLEKSLKAAMPAAAALNRKLVDIAQTNMNSGMELARDLAGARTPLEAMRLQMNYWHDNMGLFEAQAQELRAVSAEFMAKTAEPIRAHMRRG